MSAFGWSLPAGCSSTPYDEMGAYEVKVDGKWIAWDEDDNVYVWTGSECSREDGYEFLGKIDMGDTEDQDGALAEFVRKCLKEKGMD